MLFSVVLVSSLLVFGFINARNPVVKKVNINVNKEAGQNLKELNAVLISDIHLGTIWGKNFLSRVVNEIEKINADIIFIAGDILDEDIEPVIRQDLAEELKRLDAPMGVYAVLGNHEHIGGADVALKYLSPYGIKILKDSVVNINNSFYIIGRDDFQAERFSGKPRKELSSLIENVSNTSLPMFLIDHQPVGVEKAASYGVDIMLSGHTHKGQLWPINHIVDLIYKVSYGYEQHENMHIYVSSGVGAWGPPVRIGSKPEIVNLKIVFNPAN